MAGWVGEGGPYATGHLVTATEFNELRQPFYVSGTLTDIVNTAAFTNAISVSVPGNTLGANGILRATLGGDYLNDSAATRTLGLAVQFDSNFYVDTSAAITNNAARRAWKLELTLANQNNTAINNMYGHMTMGAIGATVGLGDMATVTQVVDVPFAGSGTEDTTTATVFQVQFQHAVANASLSIRVYHALLEVFPSD